MPSIFGTSRIGAIAWLADGLIFLLAIISPRYSLSALCSGGNSWYISCHSDWIPSRIGISSFNVLFGSRCSAPSLEKTSLKYMYSGAIDNRDLMVIIGSTIVWEVFVVSGDGVSCTWETSLTAYTSSKGSSSVAKVIEQPCSWHYLVLKATLFFPQWKWGWWVPSDLWGTPKSSPTNWPISQ